MSSSNDPVEPDRCQQSEKRDSVLARLDAGRRTAAAEQPNGETRFELYVVPEPEGTEYRVFVLTRDGALHHLSTFDIATLESSDGNDSRFAECVGQLDL